MNILWCITGAGHFLNDVVGFMKRISKENRITAIFSGAGYEVAMMYGILGGIEKISRDIILESEQGYSAPIVGRFAKREYDIIIIAPCTANTVAKIVHGIADSLVSNIAAQSMKSGVPVYVLPTDAKKEQKTGIPLSINPEKCRNCNECIPMEICPKSAFYRSDRVRINLLKCDACLSCIDKCEYGTITFGQKVWIRMRDIDIENVEKLKKMRGLEVVEKLDGSILS